jgi:hypothetical protein
MARDTPYPGVPVVIAATLQRIESQCDGRHERQNIAHNELREHVELHGKRLVTLVGEDGKEGSMAGLNKRMDSAETQLESNRRWLIRLALIVAGAGAAGAAGGQWFLSLL